MKAHYFALFLIGSSILFTACSTTLPVRLYTRPEIGLPGQVQTLGILDRSQAPIDSTLAVNQMVELKGNSDSLPDSYLSYALNLSLLAQENAYPDSSFRFVNLPFQLRRAAADTFPPPLSPSLIRSLCQQHQLDGILSIELFQPSFPGIEKKGRDPAAHLEGELAVGWRLYLQADGSVLRSDLFVQKGEWVGKPFTDPPLSPRDQKARQEAIVYLAKETGPTLFQIIRPTYVIEERTLFLGKRGPNDLIASQMKQAGELAKASNWEAAMSLWRPIASQKGYGKTAGMAAHNMAVGCEHLGEIPMALTWIGIATGRHSILRSYNYQLLLRYKAELL